MIEKYKNINTVELLLRNCDEKKCLKMTKKILKMIDKENFNIPEEIWTVFSVLSIVMDGAFDEFKKRKNKEELFELYEDIFLRLTFSCLEMLKEEYVFPMEE